MIWLLRRKKITSDDFTTSEKNREPISTELANIVNNVLVNPINREKLIKKFEKHPRPDNLKKLKISSRMQSRNLERNDPFKNQTKPLTLELHRNYFESAKQFTRA